MCIRALRLESDDETTKATVCKTISCLLPNDLEVKRACQLTEFLLEPTVDSYYAVETLYNEPDQKLEEESMPVPNSLRCELLLVLKTQWPFDPEFWDWKTLKRHCLALMGEEASIVSSIDLLNDAESPEEEEEFFVQDGVSNFPDHLVFGTYEVTDTTDKRQKNREMKKLREKGFISGRFRNWQAYMQYCVLCDKEFLGHRIVRHAQTHMSGGVYSCPICTEAFTSKDTLIPHVTSHVKQSCKERLTAMKTNKKLADPKTAAPVIAALQAKPGNEECENGDSLGPNTGLAQNVKARVEMHNVEGCDNNICPVGKCTRSFKFFKNLIAHVKAHGDNEEAKTFLEMQRKKVVCQYCRRHFVNVSHLNDHLQVHCGVKPYICIQLNCKASFLSNTELLVHRKTHCVFKARCMFPNCGKIFNAAFKLYDHEAQHYKTFTCKATDCGKVFHSQEQLNVHQDNHASHEERPPSEQTPSPQNVPSLIEQTMLSKQHSLKREGFCVDPVQGRPTVSVEHLGKSSPVEAAGQCRVKKEPQNIPLTSRQTQCLNQPLDTDGYKGGLALGYTVPPQQNQPTPPFGLNLEMSAVLQDQSQMFPSNSNARPVCYNHDCNLPLTGQQPPACSSNLLTVLPPTHCTEPAMSQPLPSMLTPHPLSGIKTENLVTSSSNSNKGQRERYHCAFETCTRDYSSSRSVTKHMKTVHPHFYEQWKVARTKIKVTYVPAPSTSHLGSLASLQNAHQEQVCGVQRQNIIQSPPFTNMDTSSNYSMTRSVRSQNPSQLMENVLNPIVLSQLSDTCPVPVQSEKWHAAPATQQIPSQVYPSNVQVKSNSPALQLGVPSCSMQASTGNRSAKCFEYPVMKNGSQSVYPLYVQSEKDVPQQLVDFPSPYTTQAQSSVVSGSTGPDKMDNPMQSHLSCADSKNNNQAPTEPVVTKENCEKRKQSRRSRRTKWPAILRDGKFVCCRCFRQFVSPKSLGGHLSRRTICKPHDQSELNTDLPTSFLDFLNSEHTVNPNQPQMSFNPAAVKPEKAPQSTSAPLAKMDTPPGYLQENLAVSGNESSDDIFKQIMAESTLSALLGGNASAQPLSQNSSAPFGAGERMPAGSVIQHTENVQLKRRERQEGNSYATFHHPQLSVGTFPRMKFPDPLLSQILSSTPANVPGSVATNHVTPGEIPSDSFCPEKTVQIPDTYSGPLAKTSPRSVATSGKQVKMQKMMIEQDIKRRLREQILASDFLRRNRSHLSSNTDLHANSQNSNEPVGGPSGQMSCDAKSNSAHQKQVIQETSAFVPGTSGIFDHLLNTQSFNCFRDACTPHREALSPTDVTTVNDVDLEPTKLSATQQQWMTEIQIALEKLNLVREVSDPKQKSNITNIRKGSTRVGSRRTVSSAIAKPFTCESEKCTFSSMSSEALWKHLSKTHSYTFDMVNVVKKRYGHYAPYQCQKCSKTFTRNSNLRAHYQSVHKLSAGEIADLDVKRREAKAVASAAYPSLSDVTSQTPGSPSVKNGNLLPHQDVLKREHLSQTVAPHTASHVTNANLHATVIHPLQTAAMHNQARTHPAQHQSSTSASPFVQQIPLNGQHTDAQLTKLSAPPSQALPGAVQVSGSPVDKRNAMKRQLMVQGANASSIEVTKKAKQKRSYSGDSMSPYRPYRCVHQGCVAAFTIQHNLILHYRVVHQSALLALEVNKEQEQKDGLDENVEHEDQEPEEEESEVELPHISEFRCQVKDCSRVFQDVRNLLQHYVQLHEFSLEQVGGLLSCIRLGRFACSHQGCTTFFTTAWKYIAHIKEHHKDIKLAKPEHLNGSFVCEYEGCDRSYVTKSNLLRHIMKKHDDLYQLKLKNQQVKLNSKNVHYQISKTSNGKENIESNKKILQKGSDASRVGKTKSNHWTEYGKPSLKSKVEASAMCTKKFCLQYPCMIKGCESVMKTERSILKHYLGHGLSEKYLERQRSHFIFCKKLPRQKCVSIRSDDSKSDNMSENELLPDTPLEAAQYDFSRPLLRKRSAGEIPAMLFDSKLSKDKSTNGPVVLKRKRGRPRKFMEKIVKRKKLPRTTKMGVDDAPDSSCPAVPQEEQSVPMASFKPMGFEMSFLKFLEQSNQSGHILTRKDGVETWRERSSLNSRDACVRFSNRQNLKSLNKVKIIIDGTLLGVKNLMLKQLQDMQATVVLERNE